MYDSSMKSKSETFPLNMPADLLRLVRRTAKKTGLSMADTMRQSIKFGLPRLAQQLSMEEQLKTLSAMTREECRQSWEVPDAQWDALEAAMTKRPYAPS